jgi:tight adherence protein C
MHLQLRGAPPTTASRGGAQVSRDGDGGTMPLRLLRAIGEALKGRALFSERELGDLGRSLAVAGYDPRRAVPVMLGAKALLLFLMPAAGYGVVVLRGGQDIVVTLAVSAVLGLLGPNWAVGFLRRSYANALRRGLPDALDLLVVCAEAGLGLDTAVDRVAREMGGSNSATGQELATLAHELRVLSERRQALDRLAERGGLEGFRRLASTLSQTLRYGTPLSQVLRILSAEMRHERMLRFEERAAPARAAGAAADPVRHALPVHRADRPLGRRPVRAVRRLSAMSSPCFLAILLPLAGHPAEAAEVLAPLARRPGAPPRVLANLAPVHATAGKPEAAEALLGGQATRAEVMELGAALR